MRGCRDVGFRSLGFMIHEGLGCRGVGFRSLGFMIHKGLVCRL